MLQAACQSDVFNIKVLYLTLYLYLYLHYSKSSMKAQLASNCPTTKPQRSCGKFVLNTIPSSGEKRSLWPYIEWHFSAWQQRSFSGSVHPLDNWLTALCSLIPILALWQLNHRREASCLWSWPYNYTPRVLDS